jgi:hypothetical protein
MMIVLGKYFGSNMERQPATLTEVLRDFCQSLRANSGIETRIGYDHLFLYPFHLVIRQSSYQSTLYSLYTDDVIFLLPVHPPRKHNLQRKTLQIF